MTIKRAIVGAVVFALTSSSAFAQATLLTSRNSIVGSTLNWASMFDGWPATITNDPKATPVAGLTVAVSSTSPAVRLTQGAGGWPGNFTPGEAVLYASTGPLEFVFSDDIFAFGANIQSSNMAPFTGTISIFDQFNNQLGSFDRDGLSTWAGDGSAIFLGIGSTTGFRRIVMNTNGSGVAVNPAIFGAMASTFVVEEENPVTVTPEPASFAMLGAGMLILGGVYRRRRAIAVKSRNVG